MSGKNWLIKSATNKSSRKIMKLPHTSGTISFARRTEMEEKIENAQSREVVGDDDSHLDKEAINIKDDLLTKLVRKDKNGRVLGMGFGVSPRTFSKENLDVLHENQRLNDSNKELQQTVGRLNDQVAQLGELMVKFIGSTNATFLQEVPNAQPFLSSLSERNPENSSSTTPSMSSQ
ncbi:hypothetical protein LINPERHAP1_LOCUS22950 [Linum perenne]